MPIKIRKITFEAVKSIICERAYVTEDSFSGTPFLQVHFADERSLQVEQLEDKQVEVALFADDGGCISYTQIQDMHLCRHLRELGLDISVEPYRGPNLERQLLHAVTALAFDVNTPNFHFRGEERPNSASWPDVAAASREDLHRAIDALIDAGRIAYAGDDLVPCRKSALSSAR